jgi:hypothetical protein
MQLGAIQPINASQIAQISQASSPARPAAYVPTAPTSGNEGAQPAPAGSPFSSDNLKKYAPYIIGAVILFYILNRKK